MTVLAGPTTASTLSMGGAQGSKTTNHAQTDAAAMDLAPTATPNARIGRLAAEEPVGDLIARALAEIGVTTVFGVISIHNMPILDAIARQGRIRFVPARGEAGAMNMADSYARVTRSLGVCITSTGTAAGNAAGSQVEALTAGSPVLHITTQIDRPFMDRDRAAIHDVPRQPDMLKAVSKAYVRVWEPAQAVDQLLAAANAALAAPTGPVSLEIPVDVQRVKVRGRAWPATLTPAVQVPDAAQLDALAELVLQAERPMLWLGGGARGAAAAATALVERGFAAVTSTNGRAVVPEGHPRSLGAFNMTPDAQALYEQSDLMIVVGSRLRGNETRNNQMRLPATLVQVDADGTQAGRNYPVDLFLAGDARLVLEGLLARLPEKLATDPAFLDGIAPARARSEAALRRVLGPYAPLADAISERVQAGALPWVRDVTISNSTFGNRYVKLAAPHLGVHALGGGIGQGIAMGIGAAMAGLGKAVTLLGDGGSQLMIGELATAVEMRAGMVFVLMNDRGYGVIRNIQDAQYGGRHVYSNILTPDFSMICGAVGLPHERVSDVADFPAALDRALAAEGPRLIEVDMVAIGPFAESFAGPPAGAAGSVK
ncbi:thiamine pyrophosphate-binding protein [Roseomonas sp. NAR14]|uniref:Thiamine pyrophosphate-binding protein n=1 Tax=Roseomonas acroporae TaxID=2937791 RepID=A0A9X2BUY8_9PROT|nr:thiamine pyrophosphate-binding protein [Roseomonas acroporae]MCK8784541.1 thiamine pyrophosphate-binding protein [Roseomonas acroporae]